MDKEPIRDVIDKAVRPEGRRKPTFYAITGSDIYGFPSEDGDIDVRGFHLTPIERYAMLDSPKEQVIINQDGVTEGFEAYEDIDLVSYELRKFGSLLYQGNFNVLEVVFDGIEVMNGVPLDMEGLRGLIEGFLPLDVPKTYFGMAKSNYYKYLNPEKECYRPEAKKFLYVIRGLYGAEYVVEHETIEADLQTMAVIMDGDVELVDDLIDVKRDSEQVHVGNELESRAHEHIRDRFNRVGDFPSVDKEPYREAIDDWMMKVRAV